MDSCWNSYEQHTETVMIIFPAGCQFVGRQPRQNVLPQEMCFGKALLGNASLSRGWWCVRDKICTSRHKENWRWRQPSQTFKNGNKFLDQISDEILFCYSMGPHSFTSVHSIHTMWSQLQHRGDGRFGHHQKMHRLFDLGHRSWAPCGHRCTWLWC